ncbi:ArsC family reductase [Nitrincola sp.]|uniref:ArsC family reductase n=1 Tax=Nitrincola sp. TaxID=1926584 RepID=UPI003A942DED
MLTLYGISNCDTVRKARKWLDAHPVDYRFHDFRKEGLTAEQISRWTDCIGMDKLLNKRGTTWRQLPEERKAGLDIPGLKALLLEYPALIKRPLLEGDNICHVGFNETEYSALINGVSHE